MKKSILIVAIIAFMFGSLGIGCKMNSEKKEEKEKVIEATHEDNQDAAIKKAEEQAKIDEAEWIAFKKEVDAQMKADSMLISDMKKEAKKPGKKKDAAYISSIDTMEKKQAELQKEINTYDKNQTPWEEFKAKFNKGVKELEQELNKKSDKKK